MTINLSTQSQFQTILAQRLTTTQSTNYSNNPISFSTSQACALRQRPIRIGPWSGVRAGACPIGPGENNSRSPWVVVVVDVSGGRWYGFARDKQAITPKKGRGEGLEDGASRCIGQFGRFRAEEDQTVPPGSSWWATVISWFLWFYEIFVVWTRTNANGKKWWKTGHFRNQWSGSPKGRF